MNAAQALADLTEISSQIQSAVLSDTGGTVIATTFSDAARGEQVAKAAAELLEKAVEAGREGLVQLEAALDDASVFIVKEGSHLVAAVTGPEPTVGLVFYDLRTCLRLVGEEEKEPAKPRRAPRRAKKESSEAAAKSSEEGGEGGAAA